MKISYKSIPVIKMLEKDDANHIGVFKDDSFNFLSIKDSYIDWIAKNNKDILKNAKVVSNTFYDTAMNYRLKLAKVIAKNGCVDLGECGAYIFKDYSYIYQIRNGKGYSSIHFKGILVYFKVEDNLLFQSKRMTKYIPYILAALNIIAFFEKYADIEIKEVISGGRLKGKKEKYTNDTKSDVKILDSTWFTTLVKSEAFKVRGHFRLQPYGIGLKKQKLIWINDFEKEGYVRKHKKPLIEKYE